MRRQRAMIWLLGSWLLIFWAHTACEPTPSEEQQPQEQTLQDQSQQEQAPEEKPASKEATPAESDGGAIDELGPCVCEPDEVCLRVTGGACRPLDAGESCGPGEVPGPSPSLPPCCLRDSYHCWIPPIACNNDKTCSCFLANGMKDTFPECGACTKDSSSGRFDCPVP